MVTVQIKLSVDDIITTLRAFDNLEREKLQNALYELQNDLDLQQAVDEGLDDIENGRVTNHETVMAEIKAKYNY